MKTAILAIILVLLLVPIIEAKTLTQDLKPLESVEIENQNVTLLRLDSKGDKVIVCVNGVKAIIADNDAKTVNNVFVEVRDIKTDYAKLRLESKCNSCVLSNNNECLNECNSNADCNDNNALTEDSCLGIPRKCVFTEKPKEPIPPEKTSATITVNVESQEITIPEPNFFEKILNWLSSLFSKQ
ncbi:MAG: hypothetical protein KKG75_03775 [Nanoarchaeota archaeon]|nr:hypothetical protein [Nanoarchaeota archaeon]